jgi:hypothetical protein
MEKLGKKVKDIFACSSSNKELNGSYKIVNVQKLVIKST